MDERLERMAGEYSNPARGGAQFAHEPAIMRQLETLVLEDQAVDWLLDKAALTRQATTFKALMHFTANTIMNITP